MIDKKRKVYVCHLVATKDSKRGDPIGFLKKGIDVKNSFSREKST